MCGPVSNVLHIRFTGREIVGFDRTIGATCKVRNELNGQRPAHQVVYTMGSTYPHGLAYQPRPFPEGIWEINDVAPMDGDTVYWPFWMGTDAQAQYHEWSVVDDRYVAELPRTFTAHGFGLHHARYSSGGNLVASRTTLGCINILEPTDAIWLAEEVQEAMRASWRVRIIIPPWDEWKT